VTFFANPSRLQSVLKSSCRGTFNTPHAEYAVYGGLPETLLSFYACVDGAKVATFQNKKWPVNSYKQCFLAKLLSSFAKKLILQSLLCHKFKVLYSIRSRAFQKRETQLVKNYVYFFSQGMTNSLDSFCTAINR
jgi:hypothetical protein